MENRFLFMTHSSPFRFCLVVRNGASLFCATYFSNLFTRLGLKVARKSRLLCAVSLMKFHALQ